MSAHELIDPIVRATPVASGLERRWPDEPERRPRRSRPAEEASESELARLLALAADRLAESAHDVAAASRASRSLDGVVAHVVSRATREIVRPLRLDDLRRLAHHGGVTLDVQA